MKIFQVTRENLSDFQDLYVEFFRELRGKQGWGFNEGELKREAKEYFERGDLIFIAYKDEPAGFIRLSSREGCYWIEELFVKPKFRGQGIGKALVKRAEEEVKKHDDALYLYVLPQDKDAIAFWKKMGYRIVNTIELMKDLSDEKVPLRTIEILGEEFKIFKWSREKYTREELEFLDLLEDFYSKGGTKEEFISIVSRGLKEWLYGLEECERVLKEFDTPITPRELWLYLNAETIEKDRYTPKEILSNRYLLLHEIEEIKCLKERGLKISREVIINNPWIVYECHLKAMEAELKVANEEWRKKRLKDLGKYLKQPLPKDLKEKIEGLINKYKAYKPDV